MTSEEKDRIRKRQNPEMQGLPFPPGILNLKPMLLSAAIRLVQVEEVIKSDINNNANILFFIYNLLLL